MRAWPLSPGADWGGATLLGAAVRRSIAMPPMAIEAFCARRNPPHFGQELAHSLRLKRSRRSWRQAISWERRLMLNRRELMAGAAALTATSSASAASGKGKRFDTVVVGAGISGLIAASLLEGGGASVAVVEATSRIGGRIWTLDDLPGRPEAGASQIGAMYGRIRGAGEAAGVGFVTPPAGAMSETSLPGFAVSIGGAAAAGDWATSPMNRLEGPERTLPPVALMGRALRNGAQGYDLANWMDAANAPLDARSIADLVRASGASAEALRLMRIDYNISQLEAVSALDALRKRHYYAWDASQGPFGYVEGGSQRLVEGIAARLKGGVRLSSPVRAIADGRHAATVTLTNGDVLTADRVVVSAPFAATARMDLAVPLSPRQRQVMAGTLYGAMTLIYFDVTAPFWERDGLPKATWTDGPFERFLWSDRPGAPHGVLFAQVRGDNALRLMRRHRSAAQRLAAVEAFFLSVRPAARGAVRAVRVADYTANPYQGGGWAVFRPGLARAAMEAFAAPAGRVWFCGEHLGPSAAGLEAAAESAENAAVGILTA